jgi:hypothetical protein
MRLASSAMKHSWAGLVPVVCLVVGLTAGCSDEGDPTAAEETTTTAAEGDGPADPSSEDERSPEELAADEAAAEEIVLTLDDLESGWEASPSEDDSEDAEMDAEMEAQLAECLGIDPEDMSDDGPSADSPDFTSPDDEEVSASVGFAANVEEAEEEMEFGRDEDMSVCFPDLIQAVLLEAFENPEEGEEPPEDMELGEATFNPVSFADLGDDVIAYRATVPFTVSGLEVEVYFDTVLVRVGRVGVQGSFLSIFTPFQTDEAERLMGIMVDRVPANA